MVSTGKLPPLDEVFARMTPKKAQTHSTLASQLEMVAKQYGIPVRPLSPEAHAALQKLSVRMDG